MKYLNGELHQDHMVSKRKMARSDLHTSWSLCWALMYIHCKSHSLCAP